MNKKVVAVAVVVAVSLFGLLTVALLRTIGNAYLGDPDETIGLDDFDPLPPAITVLIADTLICRGSGRVGFLFQDFLLKGDGESDAIELLTPWLTGQGLTSEITETGGIARFADDDRFAELWPIDTYRQESAYQTSQAIVSTAERPVVVLRVWPNTLCEV